MSNKLIKGFYCPIKKEIRYLIFLTLGTFLAISSITYLGYRFNVGILFPFLASSAIVLFSSPNLMSEVKSVAGGQLLSALAGVTVYQLMGTTWWSISFGIALATVLMHVTNTLHPPGGAIAFVAIMSKQDYTFVFVPVSLGVGILISSAMLIHFFAKLKVARPDKNSSSNNPST